MAGNWSIQADTTGDSTFDESVTDLIPIDRDVPVDDVWNRGYFTPKLTDYNTDGSVMVLHTHSIMNKSVSITFFTSFETILKLLEWHQLACHEYTHQNPKWVVRPLDAAGNILTLSSNRFSWCIITDLAFTNKVGDPTRIVTDVTLKAVGYK